MYKETSHSVLNRMASQSLWFVLLVTLQFSLVLCRNNYYEQYYSKYHKGHSTTEVISSSTPDNSSSEEVASSVSGNSLPENLRFSTRDARETSILSDSTSLQYGSRHDDEIKYLLIVRIAIIVGCVLFFVVVFVCLMCCCRRCYRGRQRRGFILSSPEERAAEVLTHQPILPHPVPEQPVVVQHYPPQLPEEHMRLFHPDYQIAMQQPPQYPLVQPQYPPVQPQYQHSPTLLEFNNPPDAPPPYELPPPHKY